MKAYQLTPGQGLDGLQSVEKPQEPLLAHQVRVRIHAVSLNFREFVVAGGLYPIPLKAPVIPVSDGAGEVIEVGADVTRFRVGDRVSSNFYPDWIEGVPTPDKLKNHLGGSVDGVLAEEAVFHEEGLVAIPDHLSFVEAATLPCAALTAWNALFVAGKARPGQTVLLLGTGGVSIWALQLAAAAGLKTIITSSSESKLQHARKLGAEITIDYRKNPEWQEAVLKETDGHGVDIVVEVGGPGTLPRSIASVAMGGTVVVVGAVGGGGTPDIAIGDLITGSKSLVGITVGSRHMAEDLARFVDLTRIHPVIDRVFPFAQAKEAFAHLQSGQHFGKVVIEID